MGRKSRQGKNLVILFLTVAAAFWLSRQGFFREAILALGNFGIIGAFLAGILFASSFTISFSIATLLTLAKILPVFLIAPMAGAGAVIGDLLVFRLVRNKLLTDLEWMYKELGGGHLTKLLHTKYFLWTLPLIGALIIASPFPDEIGITLLGIAAMSTRRFIILSFILNTVGILAILLFGSLL